MLHNNSIQYYYSTYNMNKKTYTRNNNLAFRGFRHTNIIV